MKLQRRWIVWLGILFGGLLLMAGCGSDADDDDSTTACLGTQLVDYKYTLWMKADVGNGVTSTSFSGTTLVFPMSDGVAFEGGEGDRRDVRIRCIDAVSAVAHIVLHNNCVYDYTTAATASVTIAADGSFSINYYTIEWACGRDVSYLANESWYLTRAQ